MCVSVLAKQKNRNHIGYVVDERQYSKVVTATNSINITLEFYTQTHIIKYFMKLRY